MKISFKTFVPLWIGLAILIPWILAVKVQGANAELESAYNWAINAGIISSSTTYSDANMMWKVTREDAAKMFVILAAKVNPWLQPNTWAVCNFTDISNEPADAQNYMVQACQLWIMGRNNDGTSSNTFNANGKLTRGQVWTMISRIFYGTKYNGGKNFYTNHLIALKQWNIMNDISKPNNVELRGYVLIMMMRAEQGKQNPPKTGNNQNPPRTGNIKNPPRTGNNSSGNQSNYSIEQAISDNAQLSTLAFDGLGFLAGNFCSDTFLPPWKVSDFFGFQYLRDVTQEGKWHSTDFVTNAANNVLSILTDVQKAKLIALATAQAADVNQYATDRFPLMKAFRRQLEWDIPSWTTALSKSAVMSYSADFYALDAKISIARAKLYTDIFNSLSTSQRTFISNMLSWGFYSWPSLPDQIDKTKLTHDQDVLVMTYAGDILSRYADDVEADTYFCPERQGDYFGGFYVKDAPAVGNAWYTIAETITADKGQEFLSDLSATQKPIITSLVTTQKSDINSIVEKRRAISTLLRSYRTTSTVDESTIITLARQYGALDWEISYYYATTFANVGSTLTTAQKQQLIDLRGLTWYTCDGAYVYSERLSNPTIENTDFLFK